jgi:hypothetical protein
MGFDESPLKVAATTAAGIIGVITIAIASTREWCAGITATRSAQNAID